MDFVIGIAGRRGSGKTTVASSLAAHGFTPTAFGDVVRREAAMRALACTTPVLQRIGNELIAAWGWPRFCDEVISAAQGASLIVVDGFRHADPVTHFRNQFGERFKLVFLDVDEATRVERLRARKDFDPASDNHPVEREVDELRALADVAVESNAGAVGEILKTLVAPAAFGNR